MAVSITQRPAAWAPVNNPVVYKFSTTSGPFTNYRIEVEVFAGGVSVGVKDSFSPNSLGVTIADISSRLKSILYRDWSTDVSEDGKSSTQFYIKYQELYTGSATSQTSDSANTKVGVLGGLQIGESADMASYTTGFLTMFDVVKMWRGYIFSLSFLETSESPDLSYTIDQYDVSGNLITTSSGSLVGESGFSMNRLVIQPAIINDQADYLIATLQLIYYLLSEPTSTWTNGSGGPRVAFTSKAGDVLTASGMVLNVVYSAYQIISIPIADQGAGPQTINLDITTVNAGGRNIEVHITYWETPFTNIAYQSSVSFNTGGSFNVDFTFTPSGSYDIGLIEVYATYSAGGSGSPNIAISFPTGTRLWAFPGDDKTAEIQVKSPCRNPVYLIWKNSLGGDAVWLFDWTQEYTHNYSDGEKCKRMVLYADGLSFNDFEAIDELNTPGNIFDVPIIELTTDVDKTAKKTDQQVYVVQPDGSKVGVVVITNASRTQTKRRQHFIEIEIEFPETFL